MSLSFKDWAKPRSQQDCWDSTPAKALLSVRLRHIPHIYIYIYYIFIHFTFILRLLLLTQNIPIPLTVDSEGTASVATNKLLKNCQAKVNCHFWLTEFSSKSLWSSMSKICRINSVQVECESSWERGSPNPKATWRTLDVAGPTNTHCRGPAMMINHGLGSWVCHLLDRLLHMTWTLGRSLTSKRTKHLEQMKPSGVHAIHPESSASTS